MINSIYVLIIRNGCFLKTKLKQSNRTKITKTTFYFEMKLYEVCLIRVIPDIFENKTFYISSKHKNLRQPTERPTAQVG